MSVPRRPLAALLLVLLGVGIGVAIAYATTTAYSARAEVLVRDGAAGPSAVRQYLPDLRELATSSVLAGNVRSTLRLKTSAEALRGELRTTIPSKTQVIRITATDGGHERARLIAQEAAVVFTQLVDARFHTATPRLSATVIDPAHVLQRNRHRLLGGLVGAAAGALVAAPLLLVQRAGRAARSPERLDRQARRRAAALERRVRLVTERELALAKRAGELAVRERAVAERERGATAPARQPPPALAAEPRPPAEPVGAPTPAPPPEPAPPVAPPEPAPIAPPEPLPARPPAAPGFAAWSLDDLDRLVRQNADRFPENAEEWQAYLFFLRDYALADGRLPASFEGLIAEVFGPLLG